MKKFGDTHPWSHGLAVGVPAAALAALLLLVSPIDAEVVMQLLVLAPLIASWRGISSGILATLLCVAAVSASFFFVLAAGSDPAGGAWANLAAFAVVGIALSVAVPVISRSPRLATGTEKQLQQKPDALTKAKDLDNARQAETLRQLQESEIRKGAIINTSIDAIVMMDDEGKVVEFNPAAEKIFGYRRVDALGREMADLIIPPAYRESHRAGLARYLKTADSAILGRRLELTAVRSSGTEFPVELVIARIADAQPPLFAGYVRDVTERKEAEDALRESEERFRTLADNISQLAWMADRKGHIFWYNQRWLDYTGSTLEDMQGDGWKAVHHPDHLDRVANNFQQALNNVELWEDTFPLRGKDNHYRWFLSHALPIRDANGEVVRWFGTNTDITEQRELQEELRQIAARLSEADRRKDEFLATLAHELRNPLAPIRTGLDIVRSAKGVPPVVAEVHALFDRQTQQLVRLVDDLLDISRITQGRLHLAESTVKLQDVVQIALETAQPLVDAAGHTLTINVPDQPIYLYADPHRLAQVISNLLNNAVKYTPAKGQIWLSVTQQEDEAQISVEDSGVGIPKEQLEKVFEMFTQVDRPLEKGYTGLGIGLTLAKSMVEMHGGRITVESRGLGFGSKFHVQLPVTTQRSAAPPPVESVGATETPKKCRRILVVDDNRDAAETLGTMLRLSAHEVRTAGDGQEAIEVAEDFRPDVVFMDLGMPKMNGYEAGRHIRAQDWGRHVVLVALSGWGQEGDKRRTKEAGFDHHLVKPVELTDVQKLLTS
jgi:PAS domain S-box-containing protein